MKQVVHWPRRTWAWLDDRAGFSKLVRPIVDHPVPPNTGWRYVLGSATLVSFLVQAVTGIILATVYVPSTQNAYEALLFLDESVPLGETLRGTHYFGASAMMVLMLAHMIRVFMTGSYKYPRELNWLAGVVLFFVTIMLAFTGQLLRWDVDAVGSLEVAVEMVGQTPLIGEWLAHQLLGGDSINGLSLTRMFALHVFILPGILIAFLALHLYLVLRHGVSEPAQPGQPVDPATYRQSYADLLKRHGVRFWPDVAWRDVIAGTVLVVTIVLLGLLIGPRALSEPPDPTIVETTPRPDWYFVWYFAIQSAVPPVVEKYLIVALPILIAVALVLLPLLGNKGERSYRRRPWAVATAFGVVLVMVSLTVVGFAAPWQPRFDATLPDDLLQSLDGQELRGAIAFQENECIACHEVNGRGGLYGPDLTDAAERIPVPLMYSRIIKGYRDMPSYGSLLTNEEVEELVAFLQTLKD